MFNHDSFRFRIALVSVLVLVLASVPAPSQSDSNLLSDCEDAWGESSASGSCGTVTIVQDPDDSSKCKLSSSCRRSEPLVCIRGGVNWWRDSSVSATPEEVPNLQNCNGHLHLGAVCPTADPDPFC